MIKTFLEFTAIAFTIFGTFKLFTQTSFIKEVRSLNLRHSSGLSAEDLTKDLTAKVNDVIKDINKRNDDAFKEAKKWFKFIIIGLVIQLVSIFISPLTPHKTVKISCHKHYCKCNK